MKSIITLALVPVSLLTACGHIPDGGMPTSYFGAQATQAAIDVKESALQQYAEVAYNRAADPTSPIPFAGPGPATWLPPFASRPSPPTRSRFDPAPQVPGPKAGRS